MCGLPGSGKTTQAKRLAADLPAVRLCPDEWMARLGVDLWDEEFRDRLERLFWAQAQELLTLGNHVILESGFWTRANRDQKRRGARALGVAVELRYLSAPIDELCRRLEARTAGGSSDTVPITREILESYLPFFDAPGPQEQNLFDTAPEAVDPARPRSYRG